MMINVALKNNCIPKNYHEVKKLVSKLGSKVEHIDNCQDAYMLFYKEDINLTKCEFCGLPMYFPPKVGIGSSKNVPVKRMFHLLIIPRLQRLYASMQIATQMRWHDQNKNNFVILQNVFDRETRKYFDHVYPDFASDL